MKLDDVLTFVGTADDQQLDLISGAIRSRNKTLTTIQAGAALSTVNLGDRVRLRNISPKRLSGLTGTVQSKTNSRFEVKIDYNDYKYGSVITVAPSCVEKV